MNSLKTHDGLPNYRIAVTLLTLCVILLAVGASGRNSYLAIRKAGFQAGYARGWSDGWISAAQVLTTNTHGLVPKFKQIPMEGGL